MSMHIPFNRPTVSDRGRAYVLEAIASGHLSGDGAFTRRCHTLLQELLSVPRVLLTTSCTGALEMSALLLDVGPGDEVILPSFTFVSTANAFVLRGATPVFADVRPDTLNLDERLLPGLITERTRVIVPVHYAGVGCEMDAIMALADPRGIAVVEDNAHGLLGRYRGKLLGTFGALATQSFHETKNFTCGEGGALVLNGTRFVERAEVLREKGTDRSRFFRGEVDKYSWVDLGSSYLPSDILAAVLLAQLEERDTIQLGRRQRWAAYFEALGPWAARNGVTLPHVPAHVESPWHLFHMLVPSQKWREALIDHLKARGVHAVFHYLPLHLSPKGRALGGREGSCPVTEDITDRLLRLPLYNGMSDEEHSWVIDAVLAFERAAA